MSTEHPEFTATMYGNAKEAFMAKAEYYEKALLRANDMIAELKARELELEKIIDGFVDEN